MLHRESGVFKTSYAADMALYPLPIARWAVAAVILLFAVVLPLSLHEYYLSIINLSLIAVVGALGLNILVGYTGQISLGNAAFLAVGAYVTSYLAGPWGLPFLVVIPLAGLFTAAVGMIFGVPSLRLKGLYLAVATLAAHFVIEFVISHWESVTGGVNGMSVPAAKLGALVLKGDRPLFFLIFPLTVALLLFARNLFRTKVGKAFVAIRDQDIAAEIIGINIFRYKLLAFAISSFYAGVCGVLYTYYFGIANYEAFQIGVSIDYLAMIIIGGLGSVLGSILGAIFVTMLPIAIRLVMEPLGGLFFNAGELSSIIASTRLVLFGCLIIFFLVVEPEGLNRLWRNIRSYFRVWPFAY